MKNDKSIQLTGGDQGQRYEVRFKAKARNWEIVLDGPILSKARRRWWTGSTDIPRGALRE